MAETWVIARTALGGGLEYLTGLPDEPSGWERELREVTLLLDSEGEACRYLAAVGLSGRAVVLPLPWAALVVRPGQWGSC